MVRTTTALVGLALLYVVPDIGLVSLQRQFCCK